MTEIRNGASKTTSKIDDKNQIEEHYISSQAFHRTPGVHVRETIIEEQFKPRILKIFAPMTQELYRDIPTIIQTTTQTQSKKTQAGKNRARFSG
jgi:hypothetical protein